MGLVGGYVDIIAGTGGILHSDMWGTIDDQLHSAAPDLGKEIRALVENLTPIRTGALRMDITYEVYQAGNSDLVLIYAENIEQEAYWNRIYVQYQEGGALGQATYTNDPHEMFFSTARGDGLAVTQVWAERNVQIAIDKMLIGGGIAP